MEEGRRRPFFRTRNMKPQMHTDKRGHVRKHHAPGGLHYAEIVRDFNRRFPVGATVWYWLRLPFGPVVQTTVRGPAFMIAETNSNAGMPAVFLTGVAGYINLFHVTELKEEQREAVKPHILCSAVKTES
jgi:hypothetical protein